MVNQLTKQEVIDLPFKSKRLTFHVVTDGLSMARHNTVEKARETAKKNPHYSVYAVGPFGRAFVAVGDEWKWPKIKRS